MSTPEQPGLTYRDAGVDIDRGETLVARIAPRAAATARRGVVGALGGFAGLFDLAAAGYRDPLLVASTDGVGTKVLLAIALDGHDTIGIDLVAMCVNDVLVQGAEPLLFLDYFATGRLSVDIAERVVGGVAEGCRQAGCALLGGETAEMPGMYAAGHYDLAGFTVGAVERERLVDGGKVRAGDLVLGLASDGVHANGYSLVRRVLADSGSDPGSAFGATTLAAALLAPTRIYVAAVRSVLAAHPVHAMAHITGGGLTDNLPRVLPAGLGAHIDLDAWTLPPVFAWLRETGGIAEREMLRTFNCGIGFAVVVPRASADAVASAFTAAGERVAVIGTIVDGTGGVSYGGTLRA